MGGSDDPENLILLSLEEHATAHKLLFEEHNKHEDYVAWKCLAGSMCKEEIIIELIRLGGIKQGNINAKSGHMKRIQPLGSSTGGKNSSKVCREKEVNAFFDPVLRRNIAKLGGEVQGKVNAMNGHLKRISQLPNVRNTGKIWITNGIENKMVKNESEIPNGSEWHRGKSQRK